MRQLLIEASGDKPIKLLDILNLFGQRGFAFLILILSLLNILIFMVPLISVLFGVPMLLLSAQMLLGRPAPVFPEWLQRREIHRQAFMIGLGKAIHWVEKLERYVKPRLLFLTNRYFYRVHGLLALVLAVFVALPIPVFNSLPSAALALLSIGLVQRDGLFVIIAYILGTGSLAALKLVSNHLTHGLI